MIKKLKRYYNRLKSLGYSPVGTLNRSAIKKYFNLTLSLNFDEKSAVLEERHIVNLLKGKPKDKILDLGCGSGRYSSVFPEAEKYIGVDFAENFIDRTHSNDRRKFIATDVLAYETNAQFELILAIGLITYLDDNDVIFLLSKAAKWIAPNGVIIVRSVALQKGGIDKVYYSSDSTWRRFSWRTPSYQMIRRSSLKERQLFELAGLSVIDESKVAGTSYNCYVLSHVSI
jgi:cyclopropane fatty-acyl-phospholipid synthase-like methyltransferase